MQNWQAATAAFLTYVIVVVALPRGLARERRIKAIAGSAGGGALLALSVVLPPEGFSNVWLLPGALLLIGYWVSGLLFVAPMPRVERALVDLDVALGIQTLAARCPRPLVELLEFAYAGIYPLILLALFVAMQVDVSAERFWTTILVTDYVCFGMLPWLQTRPPRALGFDTPWRSSWRPINLRILDAGSIQMNTFPSGHAAEGLAAALLCADAHPAVAALMFLSAALISAGAVLGRYHYAADALAGWIVALIVFCSFRL